MVADMPFTLARRDESSGDQFLQLIADPFGTQIQADAVLASIGVSLGISALIALLFCLLRPYNTIVYAPRLRHADEKHAPPVIGKGVFAWVKPVVGTKEQQLCDKVGMDATVFIRFTKMCRNIFLVLSVILCAVLIPINIITGNDQMLKNHKDWNVSVFIKMSPQFMYGRNYWAFVAAAWIIDAVVIYFLWHNYRAVTRLRRAYFESQEYQSSLHARTLMVTNIPQTMRTDEGVVRIVDELKNTGDLPKATIARNVRNLGEMIEEHEDLVRKLESVLAKFLKKGTIPDKRPMCKPSKKDPSFVKGQKVDAIVYLTSRIQELETKIKGVRAALDQRDAMPYGFASYDGVEEAHTVAYAGRNKNPHGTTVRLAPRPSDLIWKNLHLTKKQRRSRAIINNLWIALLTIVWIAPNALIAVFLSNLSNLGKVWKSFDTELHRDPKTWAIVQGVLAPAITSIFYLFLPSIFRRLAIQAGDITKTSRERHVFAKLYSFFTFNNLFVFSLFSTVWGFITVVVQASEQGKSVHDAIYQGKFLDRILTALCTVSPFWITWLLQRNLGAAVDLSQLVNLAWGSFARKFRSPTPRQLIEWTAPPPFDYANYYNYFLFYATVALCFATLQPLVLPVTALYFTLDYFLKKYLVLYVFYTKTESGGQFWRSLFNRFLMAIFFSNIVIALMVAARGDRWVSMLAALAPLPFLLVGFKFYCMKTFDDQIHYYTQGYINTEAAIDDTKSRRSTNVAVRFGHPAIFKPLMTPMVHEKNKHLLSQVYRGRLDDDDDFNDAATIAGYSDFYSMSSFSQSKLHKRSASKAPTGPFEFVSESDMDFENFKNRADFRSEHGGDGDMYGKAEDSINRSGTPGPGSRPGTAMAAHGRSISRDSDRTLAAASMQGTTYPAGYHQTPSSAMRGFSPSPDRGAGAPGSTSQRNLLASAAPFAARGVSPYREIETPGSDTGLTPAVEETTSYDYFRGRKR